MLEDLVRRSRSIRRFDPSRPVSRDTLKKLVALARLCPSGQNRQPLRFVLSADRETNETIFAHLRWAGALADWDGPAPDERPAAYILILHDTRITADAGQDPGITAQTMLLGAVEQGLGGCMIGSIARPALRAALALPDALEIRLCVALGAPAEQVQIDELGPDGDVRYWRDEQGTHHVPKRSLSELIVALDK